VSAPGLVSVTVASQTRRVDLVLPGALPVAELVPELARSVGLLDPETVHGGYRLVTTDGRVLSGETGLLLQGIADGCLLTVTAGVQDMPRRVYDDVVEAMVHVVERDLVAWEPGSGRRTALAAAALLMALGAFALCLQPTRSAGAAAGLVALLLTTGAVVVSRAQRETEAVVMAWLGTAYATAAALPLAPDRAGLGLSMAYAGAGASIAGAAALVGLREGRPLMIPPLVVGAFLMVTVQLDRVTPLGSAQLLAAGSALVVVLGGGLPSLALGATGAKVQQLRSIHDIPADVDPVDLERLGADARMAHQILLAVWATAGLLLVGIAPVEVSLGLSGTALAVGSCLIVMLRVRQHRARTQVLVGLVAGIAGVSSVAISLIFLHPAWGPLTAGTLLATGAALLAVTLLPASPSARWGRACDLVESVTMLALLPLLVLATGLFAAVRS
jgi:type VII secretion integral membrane protein EccD